MKRKLETIPDAPKNESGLIQIIMMGKSICHKLVNLKQYSIFPMQEIIIILFKMKFK